jgi:hypothetical protein
MRLADGLRGFLAACLLSSVVAAEPDVATKLRRLAQLHSAAEESDAAGKVFRQAAQAAAEAFTKVELKPSGGTEQFVRLTLNQHGAGFDGIRFTVPAGAPRDLAWAFAGLPHGVPDLWYILPRAGEIRGFQTFYRGGPGMKDVPWAETVIDYRIFLQPLTGGELQPGQEYLIWFRYYHSRPQDLYVMLRLVPVGTPLQSPDAVHKELGLSYYPATK